MNYNEVFERFVPTEAMPYCIKLWKHYGFEFKIKRQRRTKLGDYRYYPKEQKHVISINNDLNQYSFLITYLHEVAHLITFEKYGRKAAPHGEEWKSNFSKVTLPVLNEEVFPYQVLTTLKQYMQNPKASSCSDPELYQILKKYDGPDDKILLREVRIGTAFDFNGRLFRKLEKKRTRAVCMDLTSSRKYLIAEVAPVIPKKNH